MSKTFVFPYCSSKGLKITNLGGAGTAEGVAAVLQEDDDAVDPHLERIRNQAADESDEEASALCLTELLQCSDDHVFLTISILFNL